MRRISLGTVYRPLVRDKVEMALIGEWFLRFAELKYNMTHFLKMICPFLGIFRSAAHCPQSDEIPRNPFQAVN
jgi:hypothetical protein